MWAPEFVRVPSVAFLDDETVRIEDEHFDGRLLATLNDAPGEVWFPGGGCPDSEPRLYHYRASDDSLTIITWDTGTIHGVASIATRGAFVMFFGHGAVGTCD